ncbi:hypothetical protein [Demequina sp. NBRC 110057]|uniref:hypothetical protein n=1 Tax=Demequina sp. NBRC 110057 TaxID=1570346 RepID=UPI000A03BB1F|nr:hypothetical protein [Demequina sp. NBRC 110057]
MAEQPVEPAPVATPSALEHVRRTPMAPFTAALAVGILLGLLLSFLVPDDPGALALVVLGAAVAAAVGYTARLLSSDASWWTLGAAGIAAAVGVHLMAVTGTVGGGNAVLEMLGGEAPGFNDALLTALATPPLSAGTLLAGVVAAIIAGWGRQRA